MGMRRVLAVVVVVKGMLIEGVVKRFAVEDTGGAWGGDLISGKGGK